MARTYTKRELEAQYEKLPDVLKEALFSVETADKVHEIGKKSGLTIEKMGFMAEEIGRVILGLTRPSEFLSALADRLEVDNDSARKIALDVNHQIFFPLREALKQTHQVEVGEATLQKEPISPISPIRPIRPIRTGGPSGAPQAPPPQKPETQPPAGGATRPAAAGRPAIIDLGGLKVPPPPAGGAPSGFLSREEVEKIVAEKKAAAPQPKAMPIPEPAVPKIQPPTVTPEGQVSSIKYLGQPSPPVKITPIDLRSRGALMLPKPLPETTFKPSVPSMHPPAAPIPPPRVLTPKTPAPPQVPSPSTIIPVPTEITTKEQPQVPSAKDQASSIKYQEDISPKTPTINLRQTPEPTEAQQKPKPKPWSGFDPYREPVE